MYCRVLQTGLLSMLLVACQLSAPPSPTSSPTVLPTAVPSNTPLPAIPLTATPVELTLQVKEELINCRMGPGVVYSLVNELKQGQSARVVGRDLTSTWWYIRDPGNPGGYCWVSAEVTNINGDPSLLTIVQPAGASVEKVELIVDPQKMEVECTQFPVTFFFEARITVNGPTIVLWQWEASTGVSSDTGTLVFEEAGTKVLNQYYQVGGPNDYWVKLHILNPNVLTEQADFRAVC
ncbi:MAG: hypothetical protein U0Z26_14315 [Anaerolineales bacterium]